MSDVFGIGVSALNSFQRKLATSAHNISNSATEGYNRQVTDLRTKEPQLSNGSLLGTGVKVGSTSRVVDNILIDGNRLNLSNEGKFGTENKIAEQINELLANEEAGLSTGINRFFSSLRELSTNPSSVSHRNSVITTAKNLEQRIKILDTRLNDLSEGIESELNQTINRINSLAEQVKKANNNILLSSSAGAGSQPNDLIDQRDILLNELSKLVAINTIELSNGTVDIYIGDGQNLLSGGNVNKLSVAQNPNDTTQKAIFTELSTGVKIDVSSKITGGKVGGLRDVKTSIVDSTRAKVGIIVLSIASAFNAQHKSGIDANGDLGDDFFTDYNKLSLQQFRTVPHASNVGTAVFGVSINDVNLSNTGPYNIYGLDSSILDSSSLSSLNINDLKINNIAIRATIAGDDTVSTTDNSASAIAMAKAINDSLGTLSAITAKAEQNSLYLGSYTAGTIAAGEFSINGSDIVDTSGNIDSLLISINALSGTTGVTASKDINNNITLVAEDGRNIQLTSNTTAAAANFSNFNINSTTALDKVKKANISLNSDASITVSGNTPANAGLTAQTLPEPVSTLTESDYSLEFDGTNYKLTRLSDNKLVANSTSSNIKADGFEINLQTGTIATNDKYIIRPTIGTAQAFTVKVSDPQKIATGLPVRVDADINNSGTGNIVRGKITDISASSFSVARQLTPPIRVEFFNDLNGETTKYRVYDVSSGVPGTQIGPEQIFAPNSDNSIFPITSIANGNSVTYDPGYRVSINGAPKAGDVFNITFNNDAVFDDGNLQNMIQLQTEKVMSNGTLNFTGEYSEILADIGSITSESKVNMKSAETLVRNSEKSIQDLSGVNLDEEATQLIRFQQAYRAASQIITTSIAMFDSLLSVMAMR